MMAPEDRSLLGRRAGRLGVDLILGNGIDDEAALEITLGPVSLADYRRHRTEEGGRRIQQVLRLVSPYHWVYDLKWLVGDAACGPRLGSEIENAVLGVNSHLGRK
jgi:predicted component of type VI protein secretion system